MLRPMPLGHHTLSWEQPLLPQAVAHLAEGWDKATALDLAHLVVVVPTQQSGRRLARGAR